MMQPATTCQASRWAVWVLVGVVTVFWVAISTVSLPLVATAAEHESLTGSSEPGGAPTSTSPDGMQAASVTPKAALPAVVATPFAGPIRVTEVELGEVRPTSATVLVKTDRAVETYESFVLPDPPRLVVDIPNAVHAAVKSFTGRGPITEVRASQYKSKPVKVVRIVLDLASPLPYHVETTPGAFQIVIGEQGERGTVKTGTSTATAALAMAEAPPATLAQAAPPAPTGTGPAPEAEGRVEGVDYRPQDGQAEILVRTSGQVDFNVSEVGTPPGLIVEVTGAVVNPEAAKVLDVRQLPGPVERIRTAQHRLEPDKAVRIVADLKGQVRFDAVQTPEGIRLALEGLPAVAAPPAPPAAPLEAKPEEKPVPTPAEPVAAPPAPKAPAPEAPAAQPPPPAEAPVPRLSMDFKDVDINNLLRIIAEVSGQNIVAGEDVKGKVTVRLVDVPWDVALDNILRINGFGFVQDDTIIRIAKLDAIRKEREDQRKEQLEQIRIQEEAAAEPLTTDILRVSYADPKKVVESLNKVKSKRGSISVDERTASLLIQDTRANIQTMRELLNQLDQPTPQVMIEGRIVTVVARHTRALGIQWGFQASDDSSNGGSFMLSDVFGTAGPQLAGPTVTPGAITAQAATIPAAVNLPVAGPAGALGLVLGSVDDLIRLNIQISALEEESLARTLSTPRIVALDNQEAEIKQGEDVPFTTVDSSGRTTVTFEEAVLSLKVTPHVTADKRISLKIKATDDTRGERIDFAGGFAFPFNRNEATSSLLIDNGSTVVIGGVRKKTENVSETRVPWLGTIPVLGWLFKRRTENVEPDTNELLIFVTPTILETDRQAQRY